MSVQRAKDIPDRISIYTKGCPFCGDKENISLHAKIGNHLYYGCPSCLVIFLRGSISFKAFYERIKGGLLTQLKRKYYNWAQAFGKDAHLDQAFIKPREFVKFMTSFREYEGAKYLDINCDKGLNIFVAEEFQLDGLGCNPISDFELILKAKPHLKPNFREQFFYQVSGRYKDESFDFITYMRGVNSSPAFPEELIELHRILKPGGILIMQFEAPIQTNYDLKETWHMLEPEQNFIFFPPEGLKKMVAKVGFSDIRFLEKAFEIFPGNTCCVIWK